MTERLLQYIWQFQYFNNNDLITTCGDEVMIIYPGRYNTDQGPDFLEGKIRVAANIWVGNIELHINASDWHRHSHTGDPNYGNIILHVVWNNDEQMEVQRIPTVVLHDRVPKMLTQQYAQWMKSDRFIACVSSIGTVDKLVWNAWSERLMVERLERKVLTVFELLVRSRHHWEEVMWWMTARNFGLYVNADAFSGMAASIPYNVMMKHRAQILQLEALLLGQCGLLHDSIDDKYASMLRKEYGFLKKKYGLQETNVRVKFLRMRPACFPTVRIAQLAMLIHNSENLFAQILNAYTLDEIRNTFSVVANDYWHYHFRFGETTVYQPKALGEDMINSIVINTVTLMLFAYGKHHNEQRYKEKALEWMMQLPAESNSVISKFKKAGIPTSTARDSQSLIELKTQYCDEKRCLDCAVANYLLQGKR